jgi:hypothetical protein
VDHVIWTGCRILKLTSNFEMFIYFFVFTGSKKNCSLSKAAQKKISHQN